MIETRFSIIIVEEWRVVESVGSWHKSVDWSIVVEELEPSREGV